MPKRGFDRGKLYFSFLTTLFSLFYCIFAKPMNEATKHLKIIFTTDVHGNYFPYDFRHEHWGKAASSACMHSLHMQSKKALATHS